MDTIKNYISEYSEKGAHLRNKFFKDNYKAIILASVVTAIALSRGKKLLICGNGGSAADAQHIAGEFVNRFLINRAGLPAIALTTDTSVITAIANDFSYEQIFSRQVEALGNSGDILLAISTSGKSPNILDALKAAKEKNIYSIGLTGPSNVMNQTCDLTLNVDGRETPLIQEVHLACEHMYCSLVEQLLFNNIDLITPYLEKEGYPSVL